MQEAIELKVLRIEEEAPGTKTYFLKPLNIERVQYRAGQFLTLLINRNGKELRRSYSISSSPGVDDHLSITIKEVPNGEVSRFLINSLRENSTIHAIGPAGLFTYDSKPTTPKKVLFFAGGSGITPIFSLIKQILHQPHSPELVLVSQFRTEADIIFRKSLQMLVEKNPSFSWHNLLSSPVSGIPERLNLQRLQQFLKQYAPEPASSGLFYLCGPPAYMRMIEFGLKVFGIPGSSIRKEIFVFDTIPEPSFHIDSEPKKLIVQLNGKEYILSIRYPQSILQVCLAAGLNVPYSCKGGRCSSCIAICTSGLVKMSINQVLTDKELDQHLILTCVGYASTDLKINYDSILH